jgi:hypothetical protein
MNHFQCFAKDGAFFAGQVEPDKTDNYKNPKSVAKSVIMQILVILHSF